jgi:ribosome-binding factor A
LPERLFLGRKAQVHHFLLSVMPGLVPGIHVLLFFEAKAWMAGTSPAMTIYFRRTTMPRHHTKGSAPGGSQRQLRVGETVRHALADILAQGSVHDPDLEGHIITVPEVKMSPDLKLATIYVMPLGGRDTDIVIAALARNKKFLRGEIAHRVNLKFAPDLRFRVDERFDEAERIEKLLRTPAVQRDLAPDSDDK